MTWVVYVLLALNLALLTWNLQTGTVETPPPAQVASTPGEADQLPLLAELSADALRPRVTAIGTAVDARESGAFRQAERSEQTASTGASVETSPESESNQDDTGGADGTDESMAVAAAQDNQLLNPDDSGRPVAGAGTGTAGPAPRACLTLGPLTADAPVQEMSRWLTQAGATVDVRNDERREVALFWVYFPPRTSRALAVAEVTRLRGEGVTDVIAVPKGDMANAVSLGVFSRTESRDRRVREMNQRGYQPSVAPRYRVKRASWIDVSTVANTPTTSAIQARWPNVEVSPKPCATAEAADAPVAAGRGATAEVGGYATIAVEQEASYNASPAPPRRILFSGSDAPQGSETSR